MTQIKTRILDEPTQAQSLPHTPTTNVPRSNVWAAIQYVDETLRGLITSVSGALTAHLNDTTDAHDASAISVADNDNNFTATDVEGALAEVMDALQAHENEASDAHDASAISIVDSGGYFTGTDVEAALQEIGGDLSALTAAVVLKGVWDASAGSFPGAGAAQPGWSYIVSVGGTVDGVGFTANDRILAIAANASTSAYAGNWHKLDYTDQVLSVAGKTGAVTLAVADVANAVPDSRTISAGTGLSGGGDLSSDRTLALADTAVTPGSYTNADITVDAQGRVIAAANGSSSGLGDVTAASAFSNDNRLIRSDGTGKGVQASGITVDDSDNISGIAGLSATTVSPTTIELGHASDTTLSRSAAGKLDVEGHTVLTDDEEDQGPIAGGASVTKKSLGSGTGTITVDVSDRPCQTIANDTGAFTLDVGTSHEGSTVVIITNGASAGAITTSGFNVVKGDAFTATNTHKFRCVVEYWGSGNKWLFIERVA